MYNVPFFDANLLTCVLFLCLNVVILIYFRDKVINDMLHNYYENVTRLLIFRIYIVIAR